MFDSRGGGGKLPNANCDQTTKWKIFANRKWKTIFLRPAVKRFLVIDIVYSCGIEVR